MGAPSSFERVKGGKRGIAFNPSYKVRPTLEEKVRMRLFPPKRRKRGRASRSRKAALIAGKKRPLV